METVISASGGVFDGAVPVADSEITNAMGRPGLSNAERAEIALAGFGDRPAFAWRARRDGRLLGHFETMSFRSVHGQVRAIAAALRHDPALSIPAQAIVATIGFAGPDYSVILLALARCGVVAVPLQSTASRDQLTVILDEIRPPAVATSAELLPTMLDVVATTPTVRAVIVFELEAGDAAQAEMVARARERLAAQASPVLLLTYDELLDRGGTLPVVAPFAPAPGEDPLEAIFYTSGSTGSPKGAMYAHSNVQPWWMTYSFPPQVTLNYQPVSHTFGLSAIYGSIAAGGVTCFAARSDLSTLIDDIALVRPTDMVLVPRVCELLYQRASVRRTPSGGFDFADLRESLCGGRMRAARTGSAPLSPELRDFIEDLLGFAPLDGYGTTETGLISFDDKVQYPPVIEYKLIDVPEAGYFVTDKPFPRGELIVRSSRLIAGYYGRDDLNARLVDTEGFYHTGDIMEEVEKDRIRYLDRRNNVLKLAQGEFVAVAKLEAIYSGGSPVLRQVFLYGNSSRSFLLGVVVPNVDAIAPGSDEATVKRTVMAALRELAAEHQLQSYELPRDVLIEWEPFSTENGLLAGIGKYLRPALNAKYKDRLETLYSEMARSQDDALMQLRAAGASQPTAVSVCQAAALTLGIASAEVGPDTSFNQLGGDSLAALSFAMLLEDVFSTPVDVGDVMSPGGTLADLAAQIDRRLSGTVDIRPTVESVHGVDAVLARADELTLDKFLPQALLDAAGALAPVTAAEPRVVLLTGANGFLGRFLCLEWLERMARTGGRLICIARGRDDAAARQRLREAFDSGDAELIERFDTLAADHLEVMAGDLSQPRFGMSDERWHRLAEQVDVIVHPAALVNHKLPYRQLFQPNVAGTAEIIALALSNRLKRIINISTVAAAIRRDGSHIGEDDDIRAAIPEWLLGEGYANGYAASKWAAEILLCEANERFGIPVSTFRSNMILAHRGFAGQLNVPDVFTRLLLSIALTGLAPQSFYSSGGARAHYEGLPVDFIASAVVAIGEAMREGYHSFHVLNPNDDAVSLDSFVDWIEASGYRVDRIADYADWFERFSTALRNLPDRRRAMSSLPVIEMLARPAPAVAGASMPAERFRRAVMDVTGRPIPSIDAALIAKYLRDIAALDALPEVA